MKKYIFSIGLIPVQEFISEARRSRDLRAGSALLSYFMRKVLMELRKEFGAKLLIPHEFALKRGKITFQQILDDVEYSLPNRASGYCKAKDENPLKSVFDSLQQKCIQKPWEELFKESFIKDNFAKKQMGDYYDYFKDAFNGQKECPIQLIWVVQECQDLNDHKANLELIENLYANIKRTRPIRPWNGKPIGKCDQCGKREAIGPADYDNWWQWQRELQKQKWVQGGHRLRPGERLCTVCFAKRYAGYLAGEDFPSTSLVAALEWINGLHRTDSVKLRTAFGKALSHIRSLEGDVEDFGSLLFLRTVLKLLRDKNVKGQKRKKLEILKESLHELKNQIERNTDLHLQSQPSQYLVLLSFDGDSMGKHIRKHADILPEKLIDFSVAVLEAYPQHDISTSTRIFYIGGDEGLILTPLDTALQTAFSVRKLFDEHIDNQIEDTHLTLSTGITIFDRERPLGGAIRLAHEALERAKSLDGKNGLSITVQTASGNEFEVTASCATDTWERIQNVLKLLAGQVDNCRLSMGWTYEVEAFLQSLPMDLDSWGMPGFQEAVIAELRRITRRKLALNASLSKEQKQNLWRNVWNEMLKGDDWIAAAPLHSQERFLSWRESLSNQLHLIAFLARESTFVTEYTQEPIGEGEA